MFGLYCWHFALWSWKAAKDFSVCLMKTIQFLSSTGQPRGSTIVPATVSVLGMCGQTGARHILLLLTYAKKRYQYTIARYRSDTHWTAQSHRVIKHVHTAETLSRSRYSQLACVCMKFWSQYYIFGPATWRLLVKAKLTGSHNNLIFITYSQQDTMIVWNEEWSQIVSSF